MSAKCEVCGAGSAEHGRCFRHPRQQGDQPCTCARCTRGSRPKLDRSGLSGAVIAYESGALNEEQVQRLFQHLVDTGLAWTLQGSYGRTAQAMIEAGLLDYGAGCDTP